MSDSPFDDDDEPADAHNPEPEPAGSVAGRLFDGNARGPSVGELQSDYNLNRELAVPLRGVMRIADGDGVPPIAEIVLGVILLILARQSGTDADEPDLPDIDL
jgi:hypothetical protein